MIYLNNAATSWPKPESVYKAVDACLRQATFNPGRSNQAHAQFAGAFVDEARSTLGRLIGAAATQIIWTRNATEAINLALKGLLNPGDHVITSQMEHHAVFRPLQRLVKLGVEVETIETDPASGISLSALEKALRANTRLVVLCHASNVLGTINPIALAGLITRSKGIPLLVDAAQTGHGWP
jgi:selenocysteine lyase/cysteine desulfurase